MSKIDVNKVKLQTLVIKLGTSVLTGGCTKLNRARMVELVRQCALLHQQGHKIVIVTSGAVNAGKEHLNRLTLSNTVVNKQMFAAVGQSRLIQEWENLFAIFGINIGQMLLTRADLHDRERYLNARDLVRTLLENNIVPVINENDAVATAEIKVGDNDNLSALVAIVAQANKLLLLTDQEGLFTEDPRKNQHATLIQEIDAIDEKLRKLAKGSVSGLGIGGMATKLQAANIARRAGIEVTIAAGSHAEVILKIARGEAVGTRIFPVATVLESRKRWILAGPAPTGKIIIDEGAQQAVILEKYSLLAKGIIRVQGNFKRSEVTQICNLKGKELARGLCRYSSEDLLVIAGKHSKDIPNLLTNPNGAVVVHRDDLVVTN